MSTMRIDRLLDTVITQEASDLHLTVGKPPTVRMSGKLIELKTKELDAEDTMSLMKAISPERAQNELQETGSADFGFAYGGDDPKKSARFRVAIFKQRGAVALVLRRIPTMLLDIDKIGLPPIVKDLIRRPRGLFPGHRAHRIGQDHDAGVDDRLHQHQPRPAHHHRRGPDRVHARAQEVDRQPAGDPRRRPELLGVAAAGPASGPRHHPRRRDARPGDDRERDHRGRDRPPRVRHPPHQLRVGHHQPPDRRLPHQPAAAGSGPALDRPHCRALSAAAQADRRQGHDRRPTSSWW